MKLPRNRMPSHPGEILLRDFLNPMGLTQKELAEHLGWTYARVNEIVNGKRGVSANTALALSEAFETSAGFWLNLQNNYDLSQAKQKHRKVKPLNAA